MKTLRTFPNGTPSYVEIESSDLTDPHFDRKILDPLGRLLPIDVGRRLRCINGLWYAENEPQRKLRMSKAKVK